MKALDLGCGTSHVADTGWYSKKDAMRQNVDELDFKNYEFTTLDIAAKSAADVVWDFNKTPYPFPENQFDLVFARHTLEHTMDFIGVMNELWRILKKNGRLYYRVPYWNSSGHAQDPTHRQMFSVETFKYFTPEHACNFYFDQRWKILEQIDVFHPKLFFIPAPIKRRLKYFLCEVQIELWGTLEVVK